MIKFASLLALLATVINAGDVADNQKCHAATAGYLAKLTPGSYLTNGYFDCFRTQEQIYELLDTLVTKHPTLLSKFELTTTFNNRKVYGYKVTSSSATTKSLYFQGLQHAREWASGSSTVYSLVATLDDIANGKKNPTANFNLYFAPIINLDGYIKTWSGSDADRYLRKSANGVDLNRNWPSPYWNADKQPPSSETYPGSAPLSEPETNGLSKWFASKKGELLGAVDFHTNAAVILYPFGDTTTNPDAVYLKKFQVLAKSVNDAMGSEYGTAQRLYLTYGNIRDYFFRTYTKPGITIELTGDDFIVPASTIRSVGSEAYRGVSAYADAALIWSDVTPSVTPAPTTATPTSTPRPIC